MSSPIVERAYRSRRESKAVWIAVLGLSTAIAAAVGIGWLLLPKISRAFDPVDRELWKWFEENEGDPRSVEIISQEIRVKPAWMKEDPFHKNPPTRQPSERLLRVKYRHKTPFGGTVVIEHIFDISDGTIREAGWNRYGLSWREFEERIYGPSWEDFSPE